MLRRAMLALLAAAPLPVRAQTAERPEKSSADDFARSAIPAGRELAHPVVEGAAGPTPASIVAIHQATRDVTDRNFQGLVLAGGPKSYRALPLPALDLAPGQFEIEVLSVFLANANRDARQEIFVLYTYHRNGSQEDDGFATAVYEWNGKAFANSAVAAQLTGLKTQASIRARLKKLGH